MIAQIIKNVVSSAYGTELTGLFTITKEMPPLRQELIKMLWSQPKTPIQCDNSTAVGVTNETIIPRKTKSMEMKFHWIRCREPQQQLR